jgi:hypothetical protein
MGQHGLRAPVVSDLLNFHAPSPCKLSKHSAQPSSMYHEYVSSPPRLNVKCAMAK